MNRRVLDVLAVLSLLLCVAVMVAWTVGESCCTQITFRRADGSYLIVEVPYYVPFILLAAAPSVWLLVRLRQNRRRQGFQVVPPSRRDNL